MKNCIAPIWAALNEVPAQYPWLAEDAKCDVCVVGGGITGVLCALRLAEQGASVALITAGRIGCGGTAASMPCAEYDSGQLLSRLSRRAGRSAALRLFGIGREALDELEELCETLDGDCGFARRDALLFTDDSSGLEALRHEYAERRGAGFDCEFVTRSSAREVFSFGAAGGILSKGLAAEFDPYILTHLCAARAVRLGARIFENTRAVRVDRPPDSRRSIVSASTFRSVTAERVIIAAGSASADLLDGLTPPRCFFTVVSRPVHRFSGWPGRCVIRSFSSPQVTFSATPDGRICAAGLETGAVDEQARLGGVLRLPHLHERRFSELEAGARYLFPAIDTPPFEFAQAHGCCASADGLPLVGASQDSPGCLFAVCGGAGGVLMAETASRILADLCAGRPNPDAELLSPDRRSLTGRLAG